MKTKEMVVRGPGDEKANSMRQSFIQQAVLFFTAAALYGQATLSWDPNNPNTIRPGQTANFSVIINQTPGATQPAVAAQVDIACPGVAFTCPAAATTQTGRSIQCLAPAPNSLRCIVYLPAGNTAIPDGILVRFSAVAKATLPAGNHNFVITNPMAADRSECGEPNGVGSRPFSCFRRGILRCRR